MLRFFRVVEQNEKISRRPTEIQKLSNTKPVDNLDYIRYIVSNEQLFYPQLMKSQRHFNKSFAIEFKNPTTHSYTDGFLKKDKDNNLKDRIDNLKEVYLSSKLLESIRYKHVFKIIIDVLTGRTEHLTAEKLLLELSYFDANFYEFLPYRNEIVSKTIAAFNKIEFTPDTCITEKIVHVATILFKLLKKVTGPLNPNYTEQDSLMFEDYLILRCYGGDCQGAPSVLNAIIQHICRLLSMDGIILNNQCLIINDPSYDHNKSFIFIDRFQITVKSYREMPNFLTTLDINSTRFKNAELNMLLDDWLMSLSIRESYRTNTRSMHPRPLNESDYIPQRASSQITPSNPFIYLSRTNSSSDQLWFQSQVLGTSKSSVFDKRLIKSFTGLIEEYKDTETFSQWSVEQFVLLLKSKSVSLSLMLLDLINESSERVDIDFGRLTHAIRNLVSTTNNGFEETYITNNTTIIRDNLHKRLKIGEIVLSDRINTLAVLIGFTISPNDPEELFAVLYSIDKEFYISNLNSIQRSFSLTNDTILSFAEFDELGAYFTRYDWRNQRFV
ncbi:hypothetical protein B5S33_g3258 [[Candida] boidinii]|nr:hypothetical protein B5S33_g3258 [[Candida] boidinii]